MVKLKKQTKPDFPLRKRPKFEDEDDDESFLDDDEDMMVDSPVPVIESDDSEDSRPLKMVLKLGADDSASEKKEKRHKHKKKKKKHMTEREREEYRLERKERKRREAAAKIINQSVPMATTPVRDAGSHGDDGPSSAEKRLAAQTAKSAISLVTNDQLQSVLVELLSYLQKMIQRKDVNAFFAYPVNDVIAPGYSSIITEPMDFSTMRAKIDNGLYASVADYKADLKLMCTNAMTYNHPDTIYYKAAQKLMNFGLRQLTRDKINQMRRSLTFMAHVTADDLGVGDDDDITAVITEADVTSSVTADEKPKRPGAPVYTNLSTMQPAIPIYLPKPKRTQPFEAPQDNMTPAEILAQATAAAKAAKDKLSLRAPNSKFGFLRRREDGSTTLKILNPDNTGTVSETERVVRLGSLHKLTQGSGSIAPYKEDKRNLVKPVNYLDYGSFSSFAPSYDSAYANMTKEESDLLLNTYGDDVCVSYATSMQSFVRDTGELGIGYVDNLLDILTNGEHSKTKTIMDEKARLQNEMDEDVKPVVPTTSDDKAFLDKLDDKGRQLQTKLDQTADLISNLQKTQYSRLGQKQPPHMALAPGPGFVETDLADKVTKGLSEMAKQVRPGDLVSTTAIRNAMGVATQPTIQQTPQAAPVSTTVIAGGVSSSTAVMDNFGQFFGTSAIQSSGMSSAPSAVPADSPALVSSTGSPNT